MYCQVHCCLLRLVIATTLILHPNGLGVEGKERCVCVFVVRESAQMVQQGALHHSSARSPKSLPSCGPLSFSLSSLLLVSLPPGLWTQLAEVFFLGSAAESFTAVLIIFQLQTPTVYHSFISTLLSNFFLSLCISFSLCLTDHKRKLQSLLGDFWETRHFTARVTLRLAFVDA